MSENCRKLDNLIVEAKFNELQASVKELEERVIEYRLANEKHAYSEGVLIQENAKLQRVVDAARAISLQGNGIAGIRLMEALNKLDGEKREQLSAHKTKPFVKCSCICDCSEMIEEGAHRCVECLGFNCG